MTIFFYFSSDFSVGGSENHLLLGGAEWTRTDNQRSWKRVKIPDEERALTGMWRIFWVVGVICPYLLLNWCRWESAVVLLVMLVLLVGLQSLTHWLLLLLLYKTKRCVLPLTLCLYGLHTALPWRKENKIFQSW